MSSCLSYYAYYGWILFQIQCKDVLLEDSDVGKALVEYANQVIIEVLVVGASSKGGFLRCVFVSLSLFPVWLWIRC